MKRLAILSAILLCATLAFAQYKPHITEQTKAYTMVQIPDFSNGMGLFGDAHVLIQDQKSKLFCIFDTAGNMVVEPSIPLVTSMRGVPRFNSGVIPAVISDKGKSNYLILNTKGGIVANLGNLASLGTDFVDGYVTAFKSIPINQTRRRIELHYYDRNGKDAFPKMVQDVTGTYGLLKDMRPFCDGLSCFYDYKTRRYGYFDHTGKVVIPARYQEAQDFSEGIAAVSPDGQQWIYIGTDGQQINQVVLTLGEPEPFHEGLSIVSQRLPNDSRIFKSYIDAAGNVQCGPLVGAHRFFEGFAWVDTGNEFLSMNREFKGVRRLSRMDGKYNYDGGPFVQVGSDAYLPDGTPLFDSDGMVIGPFSEGIAKFKDRHGNVGYLTVQGDILFYITLPSF